jgi:hypothetical protein
MQVAAPEPGRSPLRSENVCRRNEAARATGVRIAHLACLKTRERPWLEGCTRQASHYVLNRDARASRSRFAEPNSQVPLSIGKILPV